MDAIAARRCFFHDEREAVARCPSCGQFYCRECITEHEDRVICAACLLRLGGTVEKTKRGLFWPVAVRVLGAVAGLLAAWFFFYVTGQQLMSIPSSFHEGNFFDMKP